MAQPLPEGPEKPVTMTADRWAGVEERLAAHDAAMDELRADLFETQNERDHFRRERDRYLEQRSSLQERLAAVARERDELRRFRYELIQGEAEGSREVAIQIAAKATLDRDRALSTARVSQESERQMRGALGEATDALRDALKKCGAPECETCGGTGWENAEHAEAWERGDCEDCGGVGLEWYPEVLS